MILYGIPNCDSVKKARVWLSAQGLAYTFHDLKKQGLDAATAEHWLAQQPWTLLLNRKGTTWRQLDAATQQAVVDAASASALMQSHPTVVKRPVLVHNGQVLAVGFDATHYASLNMQALLDKA